MFTRSLRAGLGLATLVTSGLALGMAPALADPATPPGAADYVGVGSDTTQFVIDNLINGATVNGTAVPGYNSTVAAGSPTLASFYACTVPAGQQFPCTPGGDITLRNGGTAIARPNGSGAGKSLLYGTGNNEDVTFARSSSGLNTAESNAGLVAYPFGRDTMVTVTSKTTASHAPATLTPQNVLDIYTGSVTNWSQIDPTTSGVIVPEIPQTGSGTRSFFIAQLTALNGGTAPTLTNHVVEVQEHDPTTIASNPNAVAPFSLGRANLAGNVHVEGGWSADRAIYNVLRGSDTTHPTWAAGSTQMDSIFGPAGFLCAAGARPLIEAAGFKQLKSVTDGGDCGLGTTTSTSNLAVYDADGTPSVVGLSFAPSGTTYGQSRTAQVTVTGAGGTPSGSVTLAIGTWSGVATLTGGAGSVQVPGTIPAGTRSATASYGGDTTFLADDDTESLVVGKGTTAASETFPSRTRRHKRAVGTVTIAITPASDVVVPGKVVVKKGRTVVGRGTLVNGIASMKLTRMSRGWHRLTIKYAGDGNLRSVTKKFRVKQR